MRQGASDTGPRVRAGWQSGRAAWRCGTSVVSRTRRNFWAEKGEDSPPASSSSTHTQGRSSVSIRSAVTCAVWAWVIGPGRASVPAPSRDSPSCFSRSHKGPACLEHVEPAACPWGSEWTGCPRTLDTENVIVFVIDLKRP